MKYVCTVCGYIYDEAKEKIKFNDLPETWVCPMCGAPKSAFILMKKDNEKNNKKDNTKRAIKELKKEIVLDDDMKKLTIGQLSILCSNLAKGCEKQYKFEEEELFKKLAKYLSDITPEKDKSNIQELINMLNKDTETKYKKVNEVIDENMDRGAKRACVWGEKVTRIINSLLDRYKKEGESMFEGKKIWICTICGFIYIEENPPQRCPICKAPNSKFKVVEGRMNI